MKRIEGKELNLSEKDQQLIVDQLKVIDEKRLDLFATISFVVIFIFVIIDLFIYTSELRYYYLAFDLLFCFTSFLVVLLSFVSRKYHFKWLVVAREVLYNLFPPFMLLWSTAICALDPTSVLNIVTFYFVIFLFAFAVLTDLKIFIFYYFLIFSTYLIVCLLIGHTILTPNFGAMIIVCLLILPFYKSFRNTRVNAQAAIILLSDTKKDLENEVSKRTKELLLLNDNLKEEIRQRKIIESRLRETLKMAESNNRLKSEFLANISHEIRTPLNAIVGFTEMMTEDGVGPDKKKIFQELIEVNTCLLLSIIDDIFDASLIRTDQINPIIRPFSVNSFLSGLTFDINSIALKYEKQHLECICHKSDRGDLTIMTDEYFLKKAFLRIIDNAYKFTEKGRVDVGVSIENGQLYFYVADTGKGIPEKDTIKIFEPFVQGDGSFTRDYGGAGLGLTIVQGITRALGASLTFKSSEGVGSTFFIGFEKSIIQ